MSQNKNAEKKRQRLKTLLGQIRAANCRDAGRRDAGRTKANAKQELKTMTEEKTSTERWSDAAHEWKRLIENAIEDRARDWQVPREKVWQSLYTFILAALARHGFPVPDPLAVKVHQSNIVKELAEVRGDGDTFADSCARGIAELIEDRAEHWQMPQDKVWEILTVTRKLPEVHEPVAARSDNLPAQNREAFVHEFRGNWADVPAKLRLEDMPPVRPSPGRRPPKLEESASMAWVPHRYRLNAKVMADFLVTGMRFEPPGYNWIDTIFKGVGEDFREAHFLPSMRGHDEVILQTLELCPVGDAPSEDLCVYLQRESACSSAESDDGGAARAGESVEETGESHAVVLTARDGQCTALEFRNLEAARDFVYKHGEFGAKVQIMPLRRNGRE